MSGAIFRAHRGVELLLSDFKAECFQNRGPVGDMRGWPLSKCKLEVLFKLAWLG